MADERERQAHEADREVAEAGRVERSAERQRRERGRVAHEEERDAAEDLRVVAEEKRVDAAEEMREFAEAAREVAETAREDAREAAEEAIDAKFYWFTVRQWALYVLFFVVLVVSVWYAAEQRRLLREQTCTTFEREYRQAVDERDRTKEYLRNLSPEDRDDAINVAIARNLPMRQEEVKASTPPSYCRVPAKKPRRKP